jgi:hypothetical protein
MKIHLAAVTLVLCGFAACRKESATTFRRPPATTASSPTRVLVVGEGFSGEAAFKQAAKNIEDALQGLPGAAADGSSFEFHEKLSTAPLGVIVDVNDPCYFKANDAALTAIANQAPPDFAANRYVVIEKLTTTVRDRGCSYGFVSIVPDEAMKRVVQHEMGHNLAGLYDEYGDRGAAPSNVNGRNCSSPPAYWGKTIPSATNCDHYQDLLRPADECIMATPNFPQFGSICHPLIECAVAMGKSGGCPEPLPSTPFPPPVQGQGAEGLDVTAVIDRSGKITPITWPRVQLSTLRPEVITGDTFAVVSDGAEIIGVAALSMERLDGDEKANYPLTARAYGPGYGERVVPVEASLIRFIIARNPPDTLKGHTLTLNLRRVDTARHKFFLDTTTVEKLKQPNFQSDPYTLPAALQAAIEALPQ